MGSIFDKIKPKKYDDKQSCVIDTFNLRLSDESTYSDLLTGSIVNKISL